MGLRSANADAAAAKAPAADGACADAKAMVPHNYGLTFWEGGVRRRGGGAFKRCAKPEYGDEAHARARAPDDDDDEADSNRLTVLLLSYDPKRMWTWWGFVFNKPLTSFHGNMNYHLFWAFAFPLTFVLILFAVDEGRPIRDGKPGPGRKWAIMVEHMFMEQSTPASSSSDVRQHCSVFASA